ncbi:TRAP transporter small permease [Aureimonas fodinaquatilis]|uniref:TRAP transporter small permease protein n=1 Tax=Aureimonas fodinaquatilis TaxID=2565783 RepID=A0A5B0DZC3_9HYPH|nr:TRAP transporter small permease [Aureimonas fodinaquatilis]KAA0972144.1 TRAP transporter small permease [Aureimonas fodinaquatilis]
MTAERRAIFWLNRVEAGLAKLVSAIAIVTLIAIVTIVFSAVVMRYGFNSAMIFSYDVSTVLFAWLIFLGLIVAERDGAHMGIDAIDRVKSPWLRRLVVIVRYTLLLMTSIYLCKVGISLVERTGNQIPSLRISARWLYTALPIGFGLLSFSYLVRLIRVSFTRTEV